MMDERVERLVKNLRAWQKRNRGLRWYQEMGLCRYHFGTL